MALWLKTLTYPQFLYGEWDLTGFLLGVKYNKVVEKLINIGILNRFATLKLLA